MIYKKYLYVFAMFFLLIFINNVYSSTLNNIEIIFDKEVYSFQEGTSITIDYELFNYNNKSVKLYVYTECDDDLDCYYGKQISVSPNSSITGSFNVYAEDYGNYDVDVIIRDVSDNENIIETIRLNIFRNYDDGKFDILEKSNSYLCIGENNNFSIEIKNRYESNYYNIYLENDIFNISSSNFQDIYIRKNEERTLRYTISVPNNVNTFKTYYLNMVIESENMREVKEIGLGVRNCEVEDISFYVYGTTITNVNMRAGETINLSYNVKNNLSKSNVVYVSYENNDFLVNLSEYRLALNRNESKPVDLSITAPKSLKKGTYYLEVYFIDGVTSYTRKINIQVNESTITEPSVEQNNNLQILSYPKEITLFNNSDNVFELVFYNNSKTDEIFIDNMFITNIPQDITYDLPRNLIRISPLTTSKVTLYLNVGNIDARTVNAEFLVYLEDDSLVSKPLNIVIKEPEIVEELNNEENKKSLTAFTIVSNSILLGIIIVCALIILMYFTGIIKEKKAKVK